MLQIQGLSKQFGSKVLFQEADLNLTPQGRAALVGPNGAGKSTLIRILLGEEGIDEGRITRAKNLTIGHLAQELSPASDRSVLNETLRMDGRMERLTRERAELETQLAESPSSGSEEDLERYGRVLEELENLDPARLEARAKSILMGMGFKERDFGRALTEFSGGWLMRVALSRVLLMDPDLLILDEPTNHLDLESLLWLEGFLKSYRGSLLLVSHDSQFVNELVTEVIEIAGHKLDTYRGNLDSYGVQKAERLAVLRAQREGQLKEIEHLKSYIERFGAKASKASQAQSRAKRLERIELIELPDELARVRFRFPPAPHSGREVVTFKEADFAYPDGPEKRKEIFRDLTWTVQRGSRVGVVGINGAGKSTLLRLLSGELQPTAGDVIHGHQVQTGYYAQIQAQSLDLSKTILQTLEGMAPQMPIAQVRAIAGAFLFSGEAVDKKCAVLSGGEKARVALAKLLLSPANFLILDEPTNHLDATSRRVLQEALLNFEGTLVVVSHDRDFVAPLVTQLLEVVPGSTAGASTAHLLTEDYEDYVARQKKLVAMKTGGATLSGMPASANSKAAANAKGAAATARELDPRGPSNNQIQAWRKELTQTEARIQKLEREQAELSDLISKDPTLFEDKARLLPLLDQQRKLQAELETKLSRWEELSTQLAPFPEK